MPTSRRRPGTRSRSSRGRPGSGTRGPPGCRRPSRARPPRGPRARCCPPRWPRRRSHRHRRRRPRRSTTRPCPRVTVTRWTRSAARVADTCRRRPRRRTRETPRSPTRPSDPQFGLWNVSSADVCSFTTSSAASSEPASDTTTPCSRSSGGCRRRDGAAQVGRPVVVGAVRRAHRAGHDHGLRPVEQEVPGEGGLLDRVRALDDHRAVDVRVRQPLPERRPRSRSASGT